jgi:hypothetical protein
MENRERQKQIVKKFMERWGENFELCSRYIEDFKIPHYLIDRNLNTIEFKKLWYELIEEIKREEVQRQKTKEA